MNCNYRKQKYRLNISVWTNYRFDSQTKFYNSIISGLIYVYMFVQFLKSAKPYCEDHSDRGSWSEDEALALLPRFSARILSQDLS